MKYPLSIGGFCVCGSQSGWRPSRSVIVQDEKQGLFTSCLLALLIGLNRPTANWFFCGFAAARTPPPERLGQTPVQVFCIALVFVFIKTARRNGSAALSILSPPDQSERGVNANRQTAVIW